VQIKNIFPEDILKDKTFETMRNYGEDPCETLKFIPIYEDHISINSTLDIIVRSQKSEKLYI